MKSINQLFILWIMFFGIVSIKSLSISSSQRNSMISSKSFVLLGFTFISIMIFESIFVCSFRKDESSYVLHMDIQLFQHNLFKKGNFATEMPLQLD